MKLGVAFSIILFSSLMVALDSTIVVLALPAMMADLKAPLEVVVWAIIIYLLVVTVLSTQAGRLGDLFGRPRVFNLGMLIFGAGSALVGASTDAVELVAFRAVQAVGGALMTATTMALISDYFPPERRGWAFGWSSAVWNLGAVAGILAGGVITTFLGWRWNFYINVPIAVAGFLLGRKYLEDLGERTHRRFDVAGALAIGAALALYSLAGLQYAGSGFGLDVLLEIAAASALLALFSLVEVKSTEPIIPPALMKTKMFTLSALSLMLQTTANYATLFLLTMYLQGVRGLDPFSASLWLVPGYLLGSLVASIGGRLADMYDPRAVASIGLSLQIAAYLLFRSILGIDTPLPFVTAVSALNGVGAALFFSSNGKLVMWDVPRRWYGAASGTSRTLGNIGMIISFSAAIAASSAAIPRALAFQIFVGLTALDQQYMAPFVLSLHAAFTVSSIIMAIAAALSWSRLGQRASR
ncbi:MAG: MFS transporter [Thermoproteus sp.]